MTKVPGVEVARLAHGVGLRGNALVKAVAIARGESQWQTPNGEIPRNVAIGPKKPSANHSGIPGVGDEHLINGTWGPSVGLWQIRSLKVQYKTGGARDASRLHDPKFNAKSMAIVSNVGTNFSPWSVYTSGAYRKYLDGAIQAVHANGYSIGTYSLGASAKPGEVDKHAEKRSAIGDDPVTGETASDKARDAVAEVLGIPSIDWQQAGWFALGAIGIILGLIFLLKDVGAEVAGGALKEAIGA